jgi:hypothetical protein
MSGAFEVVAAPDLNKAALLPKPVRSMMCVTDKGLDHEILHFSL